MVGGGGDFNAFMIGCCCCCSYAAAAAASRLVVVPVVVGGVGVVLAAESADYARLLLPLLLLPPPLPPLRTHRRRYSGPAAWAVDRCASDAGLWVLGPAFGDGWGRRAGMVGVVLSKGGAVSRKGAIGCLGRGGGRGLARVCVPAAPTPRLHTDTART